MTEEQGFFFLMGVLSGALLIATVAVYFYGGAHCA